MSGIPDQKSHLPPFANLRTNVGLDTGERQKRARNPDASLFKGDVSGDHIFDACQGEIVLRKKPSHAGRYYASSLPSNYSVGLTVLNGGGVEENGYFNFLDNYQYLGLVATQAKLMDNGGFNPDTFPVDMHGTATTVNNGPELIPAGSYVMWDVPHDDRHARALMYTVRGRPTGRILPYFRVYNPIDHSYSIERMRTLRTALTTNTNVNDPGLSAYNGLHTSIRKYMALGALLNEYARVNRNVSLRTFYDNVSANDVNMMFSNFGLRARGTQTQMNGSLNRAVNEMVHTMIGFQEGDPLPRRRESVFDAMSRFIKNTASESAQFYKRLEWEIKQRVIGMALSTASKGQMFDIFLSQPPV